MDYKIRKLAGFVSNTTDEAMQFNGTNQAELSKFNANEHLSAEAIVSMQENARPGCYMAYEYIARHQQSAWNSIPVNGWVLKSKDGSIIIGMANSKFQRLIDELESFSKHTIERELADFNKNPLPTQ